MQSRPLSRRDALKATVFTAAVLAPAVRGAQSGAGLPSGFVLPPLPYPFDALEPYIDARTMEIHHDKHHAAYVANLNKAVAGNPALEGKPVKYVITHLDAVPETIRTAVRNNAGGHANHTLFWQMLKTNSGGRPGGALAEAINGKFGSYDAFKAELTKAALGQFGSGWAWLSLDGSGGLLVESTPNQDNPYMSGRVPLLGVDVWEHAYYLKYQNKRADYVAAFFDIINWDYVASRHANPGA